MKRWIITTLLALTGTGVAFGAVALQKDDVPPFELVIDEPAPNAGSIRAQLELITAGGLYKDREINVVITKRTAPENKTVLSEFNVSIKKEPDLLTADEREKTFEKITK